MSLPRSLRSQLDAVYREITSVPGYPPEDLEILRDFANRIQQFVEASTAEAATASRDGQTMSRSLDDTQRGARPSSKVKSLPPRPDPTGTPKSHVPNARQKKPYSSRSKQSGQHALMPAKEARSVPRVVDHTLPSQVPLELPRTNKNPPSLRPQSTAETSVLRRSVPEFYPTKEEWGGFASFYKKMVESDREAIGAALVTMPWDVRQFSMLEDGSIDISWVGDRTAMEWVSDGYLKLKRPEKGMLPVSHRLTKSVDLSQDFSQTKFEECVEQFEKQFDGLRDGKTYITSKDVNTPEHREFYHLPPSAIFPLAGSALDTTRVAIAGIHTPWMYLSEGFGTCFTLHTEDFNLASINIVIGGASKVWTVISPSDASKLEAFVHKDVAKKNNTTTACQQFVRHEGLYIPTQKLEELGIRYTQFEQKRGQVVVTFPHAYHQGFNTGFNIAEALKYADSDTLDRTIKNHRVCTRAMCGNESIDTANMLPLQPGNNQRLIGVRNPSDVEAIQQTRGGRKRKWVADVAKPVTASYTNIADSEGISKMKSLEATPNNLDHTGQIVIPVVQLFSRLIQKSVLVEKRNRPLTDDDAAKISGLVMACGSPEAFRDLHYALKSLRSQFVITETHNHSDMQSMVRHVNALNHYDSTHFVTALATRYHLAAFSRHFDAVNPPDSPERVIAAAYDSIVNTINPTLSDDRPAFLRYKGTLKHRVTAGRKWQALIKEFGPSIIGLFPYDIQFGTCSNIIVKMKVSMFKLFIETLRSEQKQWISKIGDDIGNFIAHRLDPTSGYAISKLKLEDADSTEIDKMKFRSDVLADLGLFQT